MRQENDGAEDERRAANRRKRERTSGCLEHSNMSNGTIIWSPTHLPETLGEGASRKKP